MDKIFPTCTIREIANDFNPALISIENDDYRGCPPAPFERLCLWYRGTDILKTEVKKIVVDGDIWRVWL